MPVVPVGFRKGSGPQDLIASACWILKCSKEFKKKVSLCCKAFDCIDHEKLWVALREVGMSQLFIVLMQNLYCGQEAMISTEYGGTEWFPLGKGDRQGCILSPYLFDLYTKHTIVSVLKIFR